MPRPKKGCLGQQALKYYLKQYQDGKPLKHTHKECCSWCQNIQKPPANDDAAHKYLVLLKDHLPCLRTVSSRMKCERREELIEALNWVIADLKTAGTAKALEESLNKEIIHITMDLLTQGFQ